MLFFQPAAFGAIPQKSENNFINKEALKETLISLLETDSEFLSRVHTGKGLKFDAL